MNHTPRILTGLAASLALVLLSGARLAADTASPGVIDWSKPNWLTDASLSVKESNDDNVLGVSGLGLAAVSSKVTDVGLKLGVSLVPLLGDQKTIQVLSLTYNPDFVTYQDASSENYNAHRLGAAVKAKSGDVTFSFDDAFLDVDGNKNAPIYALNQLAGAAANQNDKFRNNYAHAVARERRAQTQERYNVALQVNEGSYFVRGVSSLVDYDLDTYLRNTGAAPYKGYQDYINRYDVNAGLDLGYKILPDLALTFGYRYGHQYQEQFAVAINADQHDATSDYQRLLVGLEGKLASWLTVKGAVGPDIRSYGSAAPMVHSDTTRYYAEGALTATIDPNQSVSLSYKKWIFVSSTGLVPYIDTTLTLNYHLNVTKELGLDIGGRFLEANYTMGDDVAGTAPDRRDDVDYGSNIGLTYAFTKQFSVSANYQHDTGKNNLDGLPANLFPAYRYFQHEIITVGAQFKF